MQIRNLSNCNVPFAQIDPIKIQVWCQVSIEAFNSLP